MDDNKDAVVVLTEADEKQDLEPLCTALLGTRSDDDEFDMIGTDGA